MAGDPEQEARAALAGGLRPVAGQAVAPDDVRAAVAVEPNGHAAWFAANAVIENGDLALAAELLPTTTAADPWTEAAVLSSLAHLAHANGDQTTLERTATRSAALFADIGDRWGRLRATEWVGGLADMRGEHERAAALHREGLRWAEELALWPQVCAELSWLAWLAVQTRDYAQGRELAERAYGLAMEQGSPGALVFAEMSLGLAARRDGKLDLAVTHLSHLAELGRSESQPALYLPMILVELGHAVEQGGDPDAALALHIEAFEVAEAMATMRDSINPLEGWRPRCDPRDRRKALGAAAAARLAARARPRRPNATTPTG
ncbi:hypothetical protein NKG94_07185 [Micromonospora sp. M12]